jgi:excisionase family DNA binding protein
MAHENTGRDKKAGPTMDVEEAAIELGIGRNAAYDAARRGDIPTIRIGKRIKVLREPLRRMLCGEWKAA